VSEEYHPVIYRPGRRRPIMWVIRRIPEFVFRRLLPR